MEFWKLNCVLDYRYYASNFKIENFERLSSKIVKV